MSVDSPTGPTRRPGIPDDPEATDHPPRVVLRCFPATDRGFVADVHALIERHWQTAHDPEELLELVTEALTMTYPFAAIQPRDALAELGAEEWDTWYVYRDGHAG